MKLTIYFSTMWAVQSNTNEAEQAAYAVGQLLGTLTFIALLIAMVLGFVFLIRYIIKKSRKVEKVIPKKENNTTTIVKASCKKCNMQNSLEAKFCKGCGYTL